MGLLVHPRKQKHEWIYFQDRMPPEATYIYFLPWGWDREKCFRGRLNHSRDHLINVTDMDGHTHIEMKITYAGRWLSD